MSCYHKINEEILNPVVLGEWTGSHDSDPTFRLDAFDCTTFIETVWAMSFAPEPKEHWTVHLQKIRYLNGEIAFTQRLHFISLDWMPYHEKRGAIVDVTRDLGLPLAESLTTIDRKAWYSKMHPAKLREFESRFPADKPIPAFMYYLTFQELLDNPQGLNRLRQELQKGVLLANFIRPNWDTIKYIGTRIDVSHQGFLILKGDRIILRHASAVRGRVGDEDFVEYMKAYKEHATLKGIQLVRFKSL